MPYSNSASLYTPLSLEERFAVYNARRQDQAPGPVALMNSAQAAKAMGLTDPLKR